MLLRPLPYRNAGRTAIADGSFSNAGFHDLRRGVGHLFEDLAAVMVYRAVVPREDGTAERITRAQVTVNFMPLMGAAIALGRGFHDEDGRPAAQLEPLFPPPEGRVAILSNEYWQRRYGGDPAVLGREMPGSSGRGPRIIGVLAPGFRLLLPARVTAEPTPDIWIQRSGL